MASAKPKKKNPRLASGRKRVRQDVKINAANTSLRSKYRTAVKNVEKAVLAGDKTKATELFAKMQAVVDTVADKGIFHKNKAARDKSRLSAKANSPNGTCRSPFVTGALPAKNEQTAFGRFFRWGFRTAPGSLKRIKGWMGSARWLPGGHAPAQ
eukprot:gene11159-11239_t